jgi:PAS domain S-box-containing protein
MFKFFNTKYNFQLIKNMLNSVIPGIIGLHIIAPLSIVYILQNSFSLSTLAIWFTFNIVLFILRLFTRNKLLKLINNKDPKTNTYMKYIYLLGFLASILYGFILWSAVVYNVPDLQLFLVAVIIFGMSAGAITTLGSIYTAYIVFVVPNYIFLISAFMYHGGEIFEVFVLTMFVMMILLIIAGKKNYIMLRDAISANETFNSIYENSTDGVVLFENREIIRSNKAIVKMFKASNKEVIVKNHIFDVSPQYQPDGSSSVKKMVKIIDKAMRDGSVTLEWLHKDYEGKEFWCDIVLTKIHLNGKDLLHGVWRDISHRKELELSRKEHREEIELLNKTLEERVHKEVENNRLKDRQILQQSRLAQMGEMINMIAHQWRQPLSAISSASSVINLKAQLGTLDKETALRVSKDISTYTKHLSTTIDDFRNFYKQDKSKKATSYTSIITCVLNIIKVSLANRDIEVILDLNAHDSFMTYSNELKQVIINIVKNAQDVLSEKSIDNKYIRVKTSVEDKKHILEISDNGGGIDEDVIENIFDPYFSTKLQKDGTGLGLYMSKIIIEDHCNGKLTCSNTKDGVCFKIEI